MTLRLRPTSIASALLAFGCLSAFATTADAQVMPGSKAMPQATYVAPQAVQAVPQSYYASGQYATPQSPLTPCRCYFPQGYCPFPRGNCVAVRPTAQWASGQWASGQWPVGTSQFGSTQAEPTYVLEPVGK